MAVSPTPVPLGARVRRVGARFGWIWLVDLAPLAAWLPSVSRWSVGTVTPTTLLPLLIAGTVMAAGRGDRWVHGSQLVMISLVGALIIGRGWPLSAGDLLMVVGGIGSLILTGLLVRGTGRILRNQRRKLRTASITDPLTKVLNRRGAAARLATVVESAAARRQPVGIALIDLDHFKAVNDTFGHEVGDEVLRRVSAVIRAHAPAGSLVIRCGGEEFALLTVGDALVSVDRIAADLRGHVGEGAVTISAGVTSARPETLRHAADLWAAIGWADTALYRAKAAGRNRIEQAGPWPGGAVPDRGIEQVDRVDPLMTAPPPRLDRPSRPIEDRSRWRYIAVIVLAGLLAAGWLIAEGVRAPGQRRLTVILLVTAVVLAAASILWISRARVHRQMRPIIAAAYVTEAALVIVAPAETRSTVLLVAFLPGMLVAVYWPRRPLIIYQVFTALCCGAAAMVPDRPIITGVAVAIVTAASLVAALALIDADCRRSEALADELARWSTRDPLTGLGNRRALALAAPTWPRGSLAVIDVDRFKAINDTFGHALGDAVLQRIGVVLAELHAPFRTTALRIGGDEFLLLAEAMEPDLVAELIQRALSGAITLPAGPTVTATVGTASWSEPGQLWDAISRADAGLLIRKRTRKPDPSPERSPSR